MRDIVIFLNSYAAGLTILLTAVAGIFKFWQYVNIKKTELRQKAFDNYHKLIKDLVQSDTQGEKIKLDRQVAAVYELRNYPEYFNVSIRILQEWLDRHEVQNFRQLYQEIELSINYMKKKNMNNKIKDEGRFVGSLIYFFGGILILNFFIQKFGLNFIFYDKAISGFGNYPRLIWCLVCVFLGFALIAYRASKGRHGDKAFPQYYLSYLVTLLIVASVDFAFFHIFQPTSNYLFYFLSGPMGFILGYYADQAKTNPLGLFSTLKP